MLTAEDKTGPISTELALLLQSFNRTNGVTLRRVIVRGCALSGDAELELRVTTSDGGLRFEKISFVTAMGKLWFLHASLTSVGIVARVLSPLTHTLSQKEMHTDTVCALVSGL